MHNTCDCCKFEKDGKEKSDIHALRNLEELFLAPVFDGY
jgi:hypothetical protein